MTVRFGAALAVVATAVLGAAGARADDTDAMPLRREGEQRLGLEGGLAALRIEGKDSLSVGVGSGFHYGAAVTDAFDFLIEATSSIVAREELRGQNIPHNRPTGVDTFGAGVTYVMDVTRFAPYGGLLLAASSMAGGTLDQRIVVFGAQLALGIDYRLTRHVGVGVAYRQHVMATKAATYPLYSTMFLRMEYVWGP